MGLQEDVGKIKGASEGQVVALHARGKAPELDVAAYCVFLLFIISKSIFVELACFGSADQHLMLPKYVENNENGLNN